MLVRRHQSWVFNLALRMVWRREVAEDATQEILIKAVTHLGSFESRSKFTTWLHRIAVNHLLHVRKSEMEEKAMTLTDMGEWLDRVTSSTGWYFTKACSFFGGSTLMEKQHSRPDFGRRLLCIQRSMFTLRT